MRPPPSAARRSASRAPDLLVLLCDRPKQGAAPTAIVELGGGAAPAGAHGPPGDRGAALLWALSGGTPGTLRAHALQQWRVRRGSLARAPRAASCGDGRSGFCGRRIVLRGPLRFRDERAALSNPHTPNRSRREGLHPRAPPAVTTAGLALCCRPRFCVVWCCFRDPADADEPQAPPPHKHQRRVPPHALGRGLRVPPPLRCRSAPCDPLGQQKLFVG